MHIIRNQLATDTSVIVRRDQATALLVLLGLGGLYRSWTAIGRGFAGVPGVDLFVVDYIARDGLHACEDRLHQHIIQHDLGAYPRLYVLAYILGGAVLNRYLARQPLPNLRGVLYDRSPHQEQVPALMVARLGRVVRWAVGDVIADLAQVDETPYPTSVRLGMLIETYPTRLRRILGRGASPLVPARYDLAQLRQPYDDYIWLPLNHDQMYTHFDTLTPPITRFIQGLGLRE